MKAITTPGPARTRWRVTLLLLTIAVGVGASFPFVARTVGGFRDPYRGEAFNAQVWKREGYRPRMVRDLMLSHLRPGLTRLEVVGLLGEPVNKDLWFGTSGTPRKKTVACQLYDYQIMPDRPLRLDPDHLEIYFDRRGRLESVRLWPDQAW